MIKYIVTVIAVVFGIVLGLIVSYSTSANAGLWGSIATSNWPTKESNAFKVEAFGFDFRVYEWVTENDPDTVCTVAIGFERAFGLDCFKTK